MRCTKCRGQEACLEVRRHNAAFCEACFLEFFRDQVARAIERHKMFRRDEPVLVAVSGGKDSLALWDVLLDLGYDATGFYIGLGIPGYSEPSREKCEAFAAQRGARLIVTDLESEYGLGIAATAQRTMRTPCSACGLSKRYLFNKVAQEHGFRVVATGHNLDDEAATLFGNVLRWQTGYLGRQAPVLAEEDGFIRKVKPLYRLAEREMAAYCVLRGIDYIVDECPMSKGAKSLLFKDVLNQLEAVSPGTKQSFLFGFLEKAQPLFEEHEEVELRPCGQCGQPTTAELCAFCRLRAEVAQPKRRRGRGGKAARAPRDGTPEPATAASALPLVSPES
ncbi:MAG: TIGR00269 family protein [Chloroflexi bacterium]|nr:TIGR00269 family protein [Chloroflexota bacterium]